MFKLLLELETEEGVHTRPFLSEVIPAVGELFPIPLDDEFDSGQAVRIVYHMHAFGYIAINFGDAHPSYTAAELRRYGWISEKTSNNEYVWEVLPFQKSLCQP